MQYKPVGVMSQYGNVQETLREKIYAISNYPDKHFEANSSVIVNEFQALINRDLTAVAEYFAMTALCGIN